MSKVEEEKCAFFKFKSPDDTCWVNITIIIQIFLSDDEASDYLLISYRNFPIQLTKSHNYIWIDIIYAFLRVDGPIFHYKAAIDQNKIYIMHINTQNDTK